MNSSYTGGCITYEQLAPDSDLKGVIMYPSGENMDILGMLHYFLLSFFLFVKTFIDVRFSCQATLSKRMQKKLLVTNG